MDNPNGRKFQPERALALLPRHDLHGLGNFVRSNRQDYLPHSRVKYVFLGSNFFMEYSASPPMGCVNCMS